MVRNLAVTALLVLLSPLLLPLAALFVLVAICVSVYSWFWLLLFCWMHSGRVYLICSRRRGWEPLLKNNVIPILPDCVSPVWLEAPGAMRNVVHAGRLAHVFLSKPFLVRVARFGLHSTPLNSQLAHLKPRGAVSESAQREAQNIVASALAEFPDPLRRVVA